MKIRAIAFDMDGTLLDTEKLYQRFWVEAAVALGYPMKREHARMIRSMAADEAGELLKREVCPEFDYDAVKTRRKSLMEAYIARYGIELRPHADRMLRKLKDGGCRLCLATATPYERAKQHLKMTGILELFDGFACGDMVKKGKPAPDIYLLAAEKMGVSPQKMIAVEDSPNGVRAAYAAGMHTVMAPDAQEDADAVASMCEAVIWDLEEINEIVSRIEGKDNRKI